MVKQKISKPKVKKSFRQLKNPSQTAQDQIYFDQNQVAVTVPIDGYCFSMDKSMDDTVAYFLKELGFVEVK